MSFDAASNASSAPTRSNTSSSTSRGEASALPSSLAPTADASTISRPGSAASMRVRVDKQTQDSIRSGSRYAHASSGYEGGSSPPLFTLRDGSGPYNHPTLYSWFRLTLSQLLANAISSVLLILVVIWALSVRLLAALPRVLHPRVKQAKEWDDHKRWKKETLTKDIRYYARSCGFDIENQTTETADGYYLRVNRVIDPEHVGKTHSDGKGGFPVLIMHGLFQSSGSFITSEERSLAFWLARHGGYQVFLGNNRGVYDMGHKTYSRSDPRFWDWNIRELAIYDLPALVDHVRKETGYDKIGFIGHSQGNGTMFISLSQGMAPELGEKLTYFAALAPAVYAGPLTSCFPFTSLGHMDWKTWKRFFGVLDFIPLMKLSYDWTPAKPYALLGYQMFAFLFAWTDANWLLRRKPKMFRFTPQPVSSAAIYWWAGKDGFATRGCTLDPEQEKWWDSRFPPLSIFSGGMDFLVLTEPLLDRLETQETDVQVLRYKRQEEAEHCDHFWAEDAVEWCFEDILEDIEATRPRYPEEKSGSGSSGSKAQNGVDKPSSKQSLEADSAEEGSKVGKLVSI